jgi:hypothetical protein
MYGQAGRGEVMVMAATGNSGRVTVRPAGRAAELAVRHPAADGGRRW